MLNPRSPVKASEIMIGEPSLTIVPATSVTPPILSEVDRWIDFGFGPAIGAGEYEMPINVVAFRTTSDAGRSNLIKFLSTMAVPPKLVIKSDKQQQQFFRLADANLAVTLARSVPAEVQFIAPGEPIGLPMVDVWPFMDGSARKAAELSELTAVELSRVAKTGVQAVEPIVTVNPLLPYSLRGLSGAFRDRATEAKPLLGNLCLSGQVTVWYAAPNTGKTLIALNLLIDAIKSGRIAGENVFYLNADDGSEGMATKMELMDDLGVHTLVPGFNGFTPSMLAPRLIEMASRDQAKGVFVLIDTTKKFVSLMDKKDSAAFGAACRQVAMHGGAVLNLAHTTKSPNADGTPRFSGTTDLVEDADAAYTIAKIDSLGEVGERIVEFVLFKQRGNNAQTAAYAYPAENGIDYVERLAGVREVDAATVDDFKRVVAQRADEEIVQIIATCIAEGYNTKMILGKEAAKRAGVSNRHAHRLIEQYAGNDYATCRWRFKVGEHGAKRFELLPLPGD